MTDKDVKICGHGSGNPSIKNLNVYSTSRYNSIAKNGKHKGIVEVRRLKAMTDEGRSKFVKKYATIVGRNIYSQIYRDYVYKKRSNGKYYSDCSSSGCATYRAIGYQVSNLNTAGIHNSNLFETVPVEIKNGHIMNPEVLKIADAILFAGNDPSRPKQIGHVEFVYSILNSADNTKQKTSSYNKTKKHTGIVINASELAVRTGAGTEYKECSFSPLKKGVTFDICDSTKAKTGREWYYIKYKGKYGFVSNKYVEKR